MSDSEPKQTIPPPPGFYDWLRRVAAAHPEIVNGEKAKAKAKAKREKAGEKGE